KTVRLALDRLEIPSLPPGLLEAFPDNPVGLFVLEPPVLIGFELLHDVVVDTCPDVVEGRLGIPILQALGVLVDQLRELAVPGALESVSVEALEVPLERV